MKNIIPTLLWLCCLYFILSTCVWAQQKIPQSTLDMIVKSSIGDVQAIEAMLHKGMDINIHDWVGNTPLLFAARYGRTPLVNYLISQGADVNAQTRQGATALQESIRRGNIDVVRALLMAGAHVNHFDENHETALFTAVKYRQQDAVALLLAYGADVNVYNLKRISPLLYAVESGQTAIVDKLFVAGASLDELAKANKVNPLCIARMHQDSNMERYLLGHGIEDKACLDSSAAVSLWLP